ncbi:MAG: crotonase/enoyl-CoA hydratase family protein [Actinobacteria bacterium]|nr:crotonase/enoyl-CoA hydratase family protein [Actinomycetota bacterium]
MAAEEGFRYIRYEVEDRVARITLNRPEKLNALIDPAYAELHEALDRIDADDEVRAVVFTGEGRAYCAGRDVSGGGGTFSYDAPVGEHRDIGGRLTLRLFRCLKPIIAAVNGPAVGIGATMLLPMDVRLASSEARFGFVFPRRGIVSEAASSWFLPRVVGISRALEWAMTGRVFGAAEALEGGLVRSVHEPDQLLAAADELAHEIADNAAPVSVALTRQMMWRMLGADDPMEAHKIDSRAVAARGASADAAEGVESFLEKRPPRFPVRVSDGMPDFFPWWEERPFA